MHIHHKPSLILFVQIGGKCNLEELATDYKAYQWGSCEMELLSGTGF